jgi:quercetin dioxygenase-like cupin family protein
MPELDGMRIIRPADVDFEENPLSKSRELISAAEAGGRWRLGEVVGHSEPSVATHSHPGEAEALIILEGEMELHGAQGVTTLKPGDVVYIPPDTEHGLRTPNGGRWMAIWPTRERLPGKRYTG